MLCRRCVDNVDVLSDDRVSTGFHFYIVLYLILYTEKVFISTKK